MSPRFISLIGTSIPVFWLGLLLAYLVTYRWQILPRSGQLDVGMRKPPHVTGFISIDALMAGDMDVFWSLTRHIILPAIVLGAFAMGIISRMLRSSLVAALNDDYVRTARAKGVNEYRVVWGHALRNAMIPTITVIGLTFASLLAGAVLDGNHLFLARPGTVCCSHGAQTRLSRLDRRDVGGGSCLHHREFCRGCPLRHS